ncbi:MAG: hypothetical protein ACRDYC_03595, partial [Acidimicrobiales bacterium]
QALAGAVAMRARKALGGEVRPEQAVALVRVVGRFAAPEAWWVTAEVARDLRIDALSERAADLVATAARGAGSLSDEFVRRAQRWLDTAGAAPLLS